MDILPYEVKDLIEKLDELYPHKCPSVKDNDRDIWVYSGKRELIDLLKLRLEQENETNK